MKMRTILLLSLIVIGVSSCTPTIYFTETTKKQLEEKDVDLSKVQFYNSETIVLARQIKKEDVNVVSGKVRLEEGRYIEEVIIKANTPGVFKEKNDKVLFISFEDGAGKVIPFMKIEARNSSAPPIYQVASLEWKTNNNGKKVGVINYDNNKFSVVAGDRARLLISKSTLAKQERNTRVAKGVKIE